MTTFDEREQAFENKFRHDRELQFKVQARCAKLVGLWAAPLLGHEGDEAEAYARSLVDTDLQPNFREALTEKVYSDLAAKDVDISRHRVEKRIDELYQEARHQYMTV